MSLLFSKLSSNVLLLFLVTHVFVYFHLFSLLPHPVGGKDQYVSPLNMGMKVSIPYDIANLFNRFPIQGSLAVVLALALNAILFFGVITSPFGYMFGIPSKKYVLGDVAVKTDEKDILSERSDIIIHSENVIFHESPRPMKKSPVYVKAVPRSLHATKKNGMMTLLLDMIWKLFVDFDTKSGNSNIKHPTTTTILDEMFSLMPQSGSVRSKSCDLLSACYAHSALKRLPGWVIQIYQVFSGKLASMPPEYKEAILQGMEDEGKCVSSSFSESCSENLFTIVLKSYLNFLPKEALSESVPKRKQAMYL